MSGSRAELLTRAHAIADNHGGLATRGMLHAEGLTVSFVRAQERAGRWTRLGRHTLGISCAVPDVEGSRWLAVWESGPRAFLDGVSALQAAGLTGWAEKAIHVTVVAGNRVHPRPGVRIHRLDPAGGVIRAGIPRSVPEVAAIRAAQWAASDRAAATLLAMTMQQGLAHPQRLSDRWATVRRSPRRALLDKVILDVCRGAQSLGELDFAVLCRKRGLPEPTRQVLRTGRRGRIYLDVAWEDLGVHVEIDGAQHTQGLNSVDDAVRQNDLAAKGTVNLRIPVLGLRLTPDVFLDQVALALDRATAERGPLGPA
ncbi:MAG: hypothetical protein WA880_13640 [Ornithinimicrobium sp.]